MGQIPKSIAGLVILLACCCGANAAEDNISNHFSGFASIGLTTNDNDNLLFRRDITQGRGSYDNSIDWRTDSMLGLQWQTQWSYQLETTAQFVLKDRVRNTLEESLEWGFVRYRPLDGLDIRLGRMGTDIFMLSEYRQVGYALQWVRPPQETYGLLSFYHFDGIDINKRFDLSDSTLNIKSFYGKSDQQYPIGRDTSTLFRLIFEGGGASINWEKNEWKVRYSYVNVEVQNNNGNALIDALNSVTSLWPDAGMIASSFRTKGKHFRYNQLGIAYDNNVWLAQSEITALDSDAPIIQGTRHIYLSLGRRIKTFTLYTILGYAEPKKAPVYINAPAGYPSPISEQLGALAAATQMAYNTSRLDQHSICFGVRWDFASKMALKFQAEKLYVDKYGSDLWIRADSNRTLHDETAQVFSLSWDVLF